MVFSDIFAFKKGSKMAHRLIQTGVIHLPINLEVN